MVWFEKALFNVNHWSNKESVQVLLLEKGGRKTESSVSFIRERLVTRWVRPYCYYVLVYCIAHRLLVLVLDDARLVILVLDDAS